MDSIKNTLHLLSKYNTLIKYFFKAYKDKGFSGERKIEFGLDSVLSDSARFQPEVLKAMKNVVRSEKFIHSLNQLYLLSQANSDLLAENGSPFIKQLFQLYPAAKEFDKFSLELFEFLHYQVFQISEEDSGMYIPLDDRTVKLPEYYFLNNRYIIWPLYYLLQQITAAFTKQQITDYENKITFLTETEKVTCQEDIKRQSIKRITDNARDFCDRNLIFSFLKDEIAIENKLLSGIILSDVLKKLPVIDYTQYVLFDYTLYKESYVWEFEKQSLDDYTDLAALPVFKQLVCLISDIFFLKTINQPEINEPQLTQERIPEQNTIINDNTETINEQTEKQVQPGALIEESIESTIVDLPEPVTKPIRNEYLLPVPLLNILYEEFNDILWNDFPLVEFMNVFTTGNQANHSFEILNKTRFYYLLKKIWINSSNKSLFDSEKAWVEPFLVSYNLSVSSYWNQYIKNEGGIKHREFIRIVDKLLPKNE